MQKFHRGWIARLVHKDPEILPGLAGAILLICPSVFISQLMLGIQFYFAFVNIAICSSPFLVLFLFLKNAHNTNARIERAVTKAVAPHFAPLTPLLEKSYGRWLDIAKGHAEISVSGAGEKADQKLNIFVCDNKIVLDFFDKFQRQATFYVRPDGPVRFDAYSDYFLTGRADLTLDVATVELFVAQAAEQIQTLLENGLSEEDIPDDTLVELTALFADTNANAAPLSANTPFRRAVINLRLHAETKEGADLAPWCVALAAQTRHICDRLLAGIGESATPNQETLEDYIVPKLNALLARAKELATAQHVAADSAALDDLQIALTRLVAHFERAAAHLHGQAVRGVSTEAQHAVAVLDALESRQPVH